MVKTEHPTMRRDGRQGARPALLFRHHGVSYYKSPTLFTKVLCGQKLKTHLLNKVTCINRNLLKY